MMFQTWEELQEWYQSLKDTYTLRQQYAMMLEKLGDFIYFGEEEWCKSHIPTDSDGRFTPPELYRSLRSMQMSALEITALYIRKGCVMSSDVPPMRTRHVDDYIEKDAANE